MFLRDHAHVWVQSVHPCVILSSHTLVRLAGSIHLSVNQAAVQHNDQVLKEQGDEDDR